MDMMDTVPRDGWPMRHVKVAPENDQANVSDLLDDMKGGNMDGAGAVFIALEFTGRLSPQKNAMPVKYNGHDACDSAKLMMSTEEALSIADYCRFKSYFRSIELDLERRWVLGGDREKWPEEPRSATCYAPGGPGAVAAKKPFKRCARMIAAKEES